MPGLRRDVCQGTTVIVGGLDYHVVELRLVNDTPQFRPARPWAFEQKGLLVDHCLEQFLLIQNDMRVTIQKNHPHGEGADNGLAGASGPC